MRKLRRMVLRNEVNKHKQLAKKESGLLAQIKNLRRRKAAQCL